jgi:hypothetical protein
VGSSSATVSWPMPAERRRLTAAIKLWVLLFRLRGAAWR